MCGGRPPEENLFKRRNDYPDCVEDMLATLIEIACLLLVHTVMGSSPSIDTPRKLSDKYKSRNYGRGTKAKSSELKLKVQDPCEEKGLVHLAASRSGAD